MSIKRADAACLARLAHCDFSFEVTAEATGPFDGDSIGPIVPVVPCYIKSYGFDPDELADYLGRTDRTLFVAEAEGCPIGYAAVSQGWNHYAIIDDIAVDAAHRRFGAARLLMDAAVEWAAHAGARGVRLETQSNNIAACRFYKRYGFVLGGYDRYLYQALHPGTREIALFWYLLLPMKGAAEL
ncbi:GNAT family N-acetyltransferase [Archangium violaceum]|uniref:GNAT family N-acetyltransferase n=1 Tax=Archangium violaceum TaxID=83451 RepID=UPI003D28A3CB